jgi:hypothetical protein
VIILARKQQVCDVPRGWAQLRYWLMIEKCSKE